MAKETFDRSKPHVNIGAHYVDIHDTAGSLTIAGSGSTTEGNPPESVLLTFAAPASSSLESAAVAYPFFDNEFEFDPTAKGLVESLDFQLDVLPSVIDGPGQIHVTLALYQDEFFVARGAGESISPGSSWVPIDGSGLLASDFTPVGGGPGRPDFSQPFQFGYALSADYAIDGLDAEVYVDNMTVEVTFVPEPSSLVLALVLGVSLLWYRLRPRTTHECVG
ncbi:MAG: hypothetical protein DWQ37_04250 [Planctomycetota bacterium]|nr:MAG: hypothetical protein DWQ37_04250 [Planctomycetota bacterium]